MSSLPVAHCCLNNQRSGGSDTFSIVLTESPLPKNIAYNCSTSPKNNSRMLTSGGETSGSIYAHLSAQVWAKACCIINDVPLREKLEAKPRDNICQRAAHLFLGWGSSVPEWLEGTRSVRVCVGVRGGSSSLTFTFPNLYSQFLLLIFVHYYSSSWCGFMQLCQTTHLRLF